MQEVKERIYYLDAMRGILMMLGLLLHSAQVFNHEKVWRVYSENSSFLGYYLVEIIHTFRMPAFFIVSGYFCLLTIKRYGPNNFLKLRLKRIAIPLVVTAITLNSIQQYILTSSGWSEFNIDQYLLKGEWVAHLWFLNNIMIYFLLAFFVAKYLKTSAIFLNKKTSHYFSNIPFIAIMLILPFTWIAIKLLGKLGFPLYFEFIGVLKVYNIMFYIPYFIFGIWLRENNEQLIRFSNINPFISLTFIAVSFYMKNLLSDTTNSIELVLLDYFFVLGVWFSTSLCFNLFMRYANTYSKVFYFLSDASYSVYLFHHIFVIIIGIMLINANIGGTTGLIILVSSTTLITFIIHKYLISRVKILRYLYNGK